MYRVKIPDIHPNAQRKGRPIKKPWRPVFVNHNKANTTVPATQMSNDTNLL